MPAHAGTLLPNLYAIRYCNLRAIGAAHQDAMNAAFKFAFIDGDEWFMVTGANGKQERSDVVEAANAVFSRCPQSVK